VSRSPRNFGTRSEACSIYKCRSKNLGVRSQKNFGGRGEKHAKFGAISFPLTFNEKNGELWSTNYEDLEVQLYIFRNTIFRLLRGAALRNFYTRYKMSKSC